MLVKATTSTTYTVVTPPVSAMTTPPSSGPRVKPMLHTSMPSAFAAGSSSSLTSRGMIDERAGLPTAKNPACTATTA